jgi:endoglucanase
MEKGKQTMGAMKIRNIRFASLAVLGMLASFNAAWALDNMLLWDGETTTTYVYGAQNNTQPFRGAYCFAGAPDASHSPGIKLKGLSSYRKDISGYNEIWMYVKTDDASKDKGVTFSLSIYGSQNTSNSVDVLSLTQNSDVKITNEYHLIRVPISSLKTDACPLTSIDVLYFGTAKPSIGHTLYIDEIWAVDTGTINAATAPFVTGYSSVAYGDVTVLSKQTKNVTITNAGKGALEVTNVAMTGAQSSEFSLDTTPFSVAAGGSHTIALTFAPTTPADVTGTLVLTHTATVMGSNTTVAVSGRGVSSLLVLPADSLDFGTSPVKQKISWPLYVKNTGNQNLEVSNFTLPTNFSVAPDTITVEPNSTGQTLVSFTAADTSSIKDKITFATNDPNHKQATISLEAQGTSTSGNDGAATSALTVRIPLATSSTVTLAWPKFEGANSVKVYLAPEPEGTRDEELFKKLVSEQSGDSTGCVVEKLAADANAFFRIQTLDANGNVIASGDIHAHTHGGPRAALDTAVRETHLMTPKVLQVVLMNNKVESYAGDTGSLVGDTGADWQNGEWTVTRMDGTALPVIAKYRHTVPAGQNYFDVGYATATNDSLLDVEHRLFLVFGAAIGNREILHVQGPLDVDFLLPYSDHYLETPAIQLNQVGYSPRATERWAYISGWMGDGGTLPLTDYPTSAYAIYDYEDKDSIRVRGSVENTAALSITQRSANDVGAGGEVRQIDLSKVSPGEKVMFRVFIPGIGVSWPTQVSEIAVYKAFFTVARGLYHNRWGRDLDEKYTEWANGDPDHPTVYTAEEDDYTAKFAETTPKTDDLARSLAGGHHDAGDYDQRPMHYMVPMLLMRAYEANAGAFTDGQLIIPESGNGIPDLLDEALWNLKSWLALQEADGGVRMGVESWRHPWGFYFADDDPLPYWTYSRNAIHTARIGGLFAQAARLMQPYLKGMSADSEQVQLYNKLCAGAKNAYIYATANGVSASTAGAMLLLSGELYCLTHEDVYKKMFDATWTANKLSYNANGVSIYNGFPWASSLFQAVQPILGDHVIDYLMDSNANAAWRSFGRSFFNTYADKACAVLQSNSAHRNGRPSTAYIEWGQSTAVGRWLWPVYHSIQMGGLSDAKAKTYLNAISMSADYVLGGNPNGMAWITGLGSRHPEDPDHHDSLAFIKQGKGPIPGIPVYGPTLGVPSPASYDYMEHIFYPAFDQQPTLRRYSDTHYFIVNSEFTVWECQAPQTQLFAMLVAPGMTTPADWHPFKSEHRNTLAPRQDVASADKTAPTTGTMKVSEFANTSPIEITYSGVSDSESGIKEVSLWMKNGENGSWAATSLTQTAASGTFKFEPSQENVTYYFDLQATDLAGNVSATPTGSGKTSVTYDTMAPEPGKLTASAYSKTSPLSVTYSGASDNLSGLAEVRLWVEIGKAGGWTDTGQTSADASGSFSFVPSGDNQYYFFLQAKDKAGNSSDAPTDALVFGN